MCLTRLQPCASLLPNPSSEGFDDALVAAEVVMLFDTVRLEEQLGNRALFEHFLDERLDEFDVDKWNLGVDSSPFTFEFR